MYVELYDKQLNTTVLIPVRDFINPKSSTAKETGLKPKGFQSATWLLCDMIKGHIHQNTRWAVALQGNKLFERWNYSSKP